MRSIYGDGVLPSRNRLGSSWRGVNGSGDSGYADAGKSHRGGYMYVYTQTKRSTGVVRCHHPANGLGLDNLWERKRHHKFPREDRYVSEW